MVKIIMHGCNGKMGKVICDLVNKDADAEIVAGIDIAGANAPFPVFTDRHRLFSAKNRHRRRNLYQKAFRLRRKGRPAVSHRLFHHQA